jgi:hypothetical protein
MAGPVRHGGRRIGRDVVRGSWSTLCMDDMQAALQFYAVALFALKKKDSFEPVAAGRSGR